MIFPSRTPAQGKLSSVVSNVSLHIYQDYTVCPELTPHDRPQVMTRVELGQCCVTQGALHSPGTRLARPDKCAWLECRSDTREVRIT